MANMANYMMMMILLGSYVQGLELIVCRQGQTIPIKLENLSPYDELGPCFPTTTPPITTSTATTAPIATTSSPTLSPTTAAPTQTTTTTTQSSVAAGAQNQTTTPATPQTQTTVPAIAQTTAPTIVAIQTAAPATGLNQTTVPIMSSVNATLAPAVTSGATPAPTDKHTGVEHNDEIHGWEAQGSFQHGQMHAVVKSKKGLPANMDPNDRRVQVLYFLQFYSPVSVYEQPSAVFLFFNAKKPVAHKPNMRIN